MASSHRGPRLDPGPVHPDRVDDRFVLREVRHVGDGFILQRVTDFEAEIVCLLKLANTRVFEPIDREVEIYKIFETSGWPERFPRLHFEGHFQGRRAMVIDLMGQNMHALYHRNPPRPIHHSYFFVVDALHALEQLHDIDYVHRFIEPDKFVYGHPGIDDLFDTRLLDFAKASKYREEVNGRYIHIPNESQEPVPSSLIFGSRRANLLLPVSRKDDLESLLYCLVYIATGTLPWIRQDGAPATSNIELMADIKRRTSASSLLQDLPETYYRLRAYIWRLQFKHTPNYERMRGIFTAESQEMEASLAM